MATNRKRMNVSFTPEELSRVRALSKQLGLSMSELLRRLVLAYDALDPVSLPIFLPTQRLLEINAQQVRLGNQLKQALDSDEAPRSPATIRRIEKLVTEIGEVQHSLRRSAEEALASTRVFSGESESPA